MKGRKIHSRRKTSVAAELIVGFTELADALESGRDIETEFNGYQMQLNLEPHTYSAQMVKETRRILRASQAVFAKFLGVSVKTVSEWEQGLGKPKPIACRFMDEINQNPEYYIDRLRSSVVRKDRTIVRSSPSSPIVRTTAR